MNRLAVLSALAILLVGESIEDSPKKIIRREAKQGSTGAVKAEEHHKGEHHHKAEQHKSKMNVHHSGHIAKTEKAAAEAKSESHGKHHHKHSHHKSQTQAQPKQAVKQQGGTPQAHKGGSTQHAQTHKGGAKHSPASPPQANTGFQFGQNSLLKINRKGGGPETQERGARSKSQITVYLTGPSRKRFIIDPSAHNNHLPMMGNSQDDESLFNLLDSGDNDRNIYIQSASQRSSEYIMDYGNHLELSVMQDIWQLRPSTRGGGKVSFWSGNHNHYLGDDNGALSLEETDSPKCDFTATLKDVAWGRSPNEKPVTTAVKVILTGVGNKNLKAVNGKLEMVDDWSLETQFMLVDSGDSRSLLLAHDGKYVREDPDGSLSLAAYDANDKNQNWWIMSEDDGAYSSFEANSGKFMIDNSSAVPFISDSDARYHVGNAKKWKVSVVDIWFQLATSYDAPSHTTTVHTS
jgi:hypothetical protein